MAAPVAVSNTSTAPWDQILPGWAHTAEDGKRIFVVITYLTYQGEGVMGATFNGVALTKRAVSQEAFGQFHTVEIFSADSTALAGAGTIQTTATVGSPTIFRAAAFNIANGSSDGSIVGLVTAMSGVTTRYQYGFGYDPDALVIGWLDVFNQQTAGPYTMTEGTQLHSEIRWAFGWRQGNGTETRFTFDTGGDTANGEQFNVTFTIPSANESISGGAYQPLMGRVTSLVGNFAAVSGLPHVCLAQNTSALPNSQTPYLPIGCTVRNLQVNVKVAPGVGNQRTFQMYQNAVATDIVLTIANLEMGNTAVGIDLPCHRFTQIELRETSTGATTANTEYTYCLESESGIANQSVYGPGGYLYSFAPTLGNTGRANLFSGIGTSTGCWLNTRANEGRVGADGELVGILLIYQREIGQSKYDAYVWKSTDDGQTYVRQDGSGGTPDTYKQLTRDAGVSQPGWNFWYVDLSTAAVPFLFGNQAYIELTGTDNTGGGLNFRMMALAVYRATTNGEWFVNGETTNNNQLFYDPHSNRDVGNAAPESAAEYVIGPTTVPVTITGINWGVQNPPGVGKSRSWVERHNGISEITATISDNNHGAFANGLSLLAVDDRFAVEPGEAWTTQAAWTTAWWTLRGFMTPPVPPPPPECPGEIESPRTDGLPYVPPTADACSGTGERNGPRIGA